MRDQKAPRQGITMDDKRQYSPVAEQAEGSFGQEMKQAITCIVPGCGTDLTESSHYLRRHKVCQPHLKALSVMLDGVDCRFCQQCGRFQPVPEFRADRKSCEVALQAHNARRRVKRDSGTGGGCASERRPRGSKRSLVAAAEDPSSSEDGTVGVSRKAAPRRSGSLRSAKAGGAAGGGSDSGRAVGSDGLPANLSDGGCISSQSPNNSFGSPEIGAAPQQPQQYVQQHMQPQLTSRLAPSPGSPAEYEQQQQQQLYCGGGGYSDAYTTGMPGQFVQLPARPYGSGGGCSGFAAPGTAGSVPSSFAGLPTPMTTACQAPSRGPDVFRSQQLLMDHTPSQRQQQPQQQHMLLQQQNSYHAASSSSMAFNQQQQHKKDLLLGGGTLAGWMTDEAARHQQQLLLQQHFMGAGLACMPLQQPGDSTAHLPGGVSYAAVQPQAQPQPQWQPLVGQPPHQFVKGSQPASFVNLLHDGSPQQPTAEAALFSSAQHSSSGGGGAAAAARQQPGTAEQAALQPEPAAAKAAAAPGIALGATQPQQEAAPAANAPAAAGHTSSVGDDDELLDQTLEMLLSTYPDWQVIQEAAADKAAQGSYPPPLGASSGTATPATAAATTSSPSSSNMNGNCLSGPLSVLSLPSGPLPQLFADPIASAGVPACDNIFGGMDFLAPGAAGLEAPAAAVAAAATTLSCTSNAMRTCAGSQHAMHAGGFLVPAVTAGHPAAAAMAAAGGPSGHALHPAHSMPAAAAGPYGGGVMASTAVSGPSSYQPGAMLGPPMSTGGPGPYPYPAAVGMTPGMPLSQAVLDMAAMQQQQLQQPWSRPAAPQQQLQHRQLPAGMHASIAPPQPQPSLSIPIAVPGSSQLRPPQWQQAPHPLQQRQEMLQALQQQLSARHHSQQLVRLSVKLHGVTPEQLPASTVLAMERVLLNNADDMDAMLLHPSFRQGCIQMDIDVLVKCERGQQQQQAQDAAPADDGGEAAAADGSSVFLAGGMDSAAVAAAEAKLRSALPFAVLVQALLQLAVPLPPAAGSAASTAAGASVRAIYAQVGDCMGVWRADAGLLQDWSSGLPAHLVCHEAAASAWRPQMLSVSTAGGPAPAAEGDGCTEPEAALQTMQLEVELVGTSGTRSAPASLWCTQRGQFLPLVCQQPMQHQQKQQQLLRALVGCPDAEPGLILVEAEQQHALPAAAAAAQQQGLDALTCKSVLMPILVCSSPAMAGEVSGKLLQDSQQRAEVLLQLGMLLDCGIMLQQRHRRQPSLPAMRQQWLQQLLNRPRYYRAIRTMGAKLLLFCSLHDMPATGAHVAGVLKFLQLSVRVQPPMPPSPQRAAQPAQQQDGLCAAAGEDLAAQVAAAARRQAIPSVHDWQFEDVDCKAASSSARSSKSSSANWPAAVASSTATKAACSGKGGASAQQPVLHDGGSPSAAVLDAGDDLESPINILRGAAQMLVMLTLMYVLLDMGAAVYKGQSPVQQLLVSLAQLKHIAGIMLVPLGMMCLGLVLAICQYGLSRPQLQPPHSHTWSGTSRTGSTGPADGKAGASCKAGASSSAAPLADA